MEDSKNALWNGVKFDAQLELTEEQLEEIREKPKAEAQKKTLAEEYGISRQTLYMALGRN